MESHERWCCLTLIQGGAGDTNHYPRALTQCHWMKHPNSWLCFFLFSRKRSACSRSCNVSLRVKGQLPKTAETDPMQNKNFTARCWVGHMHVVHDLHTLHKGWIAGRVACLATEECVLFQNNTTCPFFSSVWVHMLVCWFLFICELMPKLVNDCLVLISTLLKCESRSFLSDLCCMIILFVLQISRRRPWRRQTHSRTPLSNIGEPLLR